MANEEMYVIEGAKAAREGEILPFSVVWTGFTTVSSGLTTAYRDGIDVSATLLTGSEATSGNVQTLRLCTIPAGYGGSEVVLEARVDVTGGGRFTTGLVVRILKPGQVS